MVKIYFIVYINSIILFSSIYYNSDDIFRRITNNKIIFDIKKYNKLKKISHTNKK